MIMRARTTVACLWAVLALAGSTPLAAQSAQAAERTKAPGKAVEAVSLEAKACMLDGSPAAGVKVTFYDSKFDRRGGTPQERSWAGVTDEKGSLRIEVPAGEVSVSASCRIAADPGAKFAPCSISMPQAAFASSDLSRRAAILLAPATSGLKGVVSGSDGKPIPGVIVDLALVGDHGNCSYKATTDNDGRYQFTGLTAAHYSISSVSPPCGSQWIRLAGWKMRQDVIIGEGKTATQDFQLSPGARLKGRVLDDTGKPIANADVSCDLDSATEVGPQHMYQLPGQWYRAEARTDKAGCFVLGALTRETYRVHVQPPEGSDLAGGGVRGINAIEGPDVALQDIGLSKGAAIQGIAVGPDGKPIAGGEARLLARGRQETSNTDANGRFTFKGLPTGRYKVIVNPPEDSVCCARAVDGIGAVRGFCAEERIELPLGAAVNGTVTGPDGKAVSGALVYVNYSIPKMGSVGPGWRTSSDEAGRFCIKGLGVPPEGAAGGAWQLVLTPPPETLELKSVSETLEALAPGKQVERNAQLSAGMAAITGVVSGPDGKPLPGCRMAAVRLAGRGSCTGVCYAVKKSDAAGRFTIGRIEPDSWSVTAEPPENSDLVPLLEPARNLKAGIANVNVTLKKGAAIFGRILTTAGQPVVAAGISAKNTGRDRQWIPSMAENRLPVRTSADGTFRLAGLPAGQYQVSCHPVSPEYGAAEVSVTVPAGGDVEARIGAFRVSSVHGRIGGGKLPQGCYLEFMPQGGEAAGRRANLRADGQFSLGQLAPGKYALKLAFWDRGKQGLLASTPKEVTLKEGEDLELQMQAEPGGVVDPKGNPGTF